MGKFGEVRHARAAFERAAFGVYRAGRGKHVFHHVLFRVFGREPHCGGCEPASNHAAGRGPLPDHRPESVWDKQVGHHQTVKFPATIRPGREPAGRVGKRNHAIIFEQIGGRTMAYTVKAYALEKINLAPEDTTEEVLQNVAVILSTPKFSVPLERGLGLAQRFLDKPIPAAQSILISEVLEAIEEFEPRAEVENVTFELGDRPGTLIPIVEVKIIGGDE